MHTSSRRSLGLVAGVTAVVLIYAWIEATPETRDNALSDTPGTRDVALISDTEARGSDPSAALPIPRAQEAPRLRRRGTELAGAQEAHAQRLDGRVLVPPGTPGTERMLVVGTAYIPRDELFFDRSPVEARVRSSGSFSLSVPEGWSEVALRLESRYVRLERKQRFRPGDEIVLRPELGGRIEGRVVTKDGEGLSMATVRLMALETAEEAEDFDTVHEETARSEPAGGRRLSMAMTRGSGRFSFDAVPPGDFQIKAMHRHGALLSGRVEVTVEAARTHELELALRPGVVLSGQIVGDTANRRHEIEVFSIQTDGSEVRVGGTSTSSTFRIPHLPAGPLALRSEHCEELILEGSPGDVIGDIELLARAAAEIRGRVVWPDHRPAEGLRVSCRRARGDPLSASKPRAVGVVLSGDDVAAMDWGDWGMTAITDSEGAFVLSNLVSETSYGVRATQIGERSASGTSRERWVRAPTQGVEIVLPGSLITGVVADNAGQPVPNAEVYVDSQTFGTPAREGRFETYVGTGTHWVHARAAGYAPSEPIAVGAGGQTSGVVLELQEAHGRIEGLVQDLDGTPRAGVRVRAMKSLLAGEALSSGLFEQASALSDANGRFALDELPETLLHVFATTGYHGDARITWISGDDAGPVARGRFGASGAPSSFAGQTVDLRAGTPPTLHLTLLPRDPVRISGAVLLPRGWSEDTTHVTWFLSGRQDDTAPVDQGRFDLRLNRPGTYEVLAQDAGQRRAIVVTIPDVDSHELVLDFR